MIQWMVGNLISGSIAFSKTSLNIRKFMVHVLLSPGLENFEHYFTSVSVSEWVKSLSRVRLFATPWTVAHQAPPSMGFSRQEYWSGVPSIALILHASKVMLKIFQARLQQYVNHELPDVQAGFRRGRGTRDQIANICWIIKTKTKTKTKTRSSRKTSIFALLTMPKPLSVWITINWGKFWER